MESRYFTCPWHGFRFDCMTGECLTAPQAQLEQVPLRENRDWCATRHSDADRGAVASDLLSGDPGWLAVRQPT